MKLVAVHSEVKSAYYIESFLNFNGSCKFSIYIDVYILLNDANSKL